MSVAVEGRVDQRGAANFVGSVEIGARLRQDLDPLHRIKGVFFSNNHALAAASGSAPPLSSTASTLFAVILELAVAAHAFFDTILSTKVFLLINKCSEKNV